MTAILPRSRAENDRIFNLHHLSLYTINFPEEDMDWHFIVGPVVGAVIGLVTNGIALKMIFRPLYPKYIGKWKLPFTPGLIPKERGRLAKSIGNAISVNLMSPEVLEKTLLSEEMTGKVSSVIDGFFSGLAKETRSLREYLYDKVTERDTEKAISSVREEVCALLVKKLSDPHILNSLAVLS